MRGVAFQHAYAVLTMIDAVEDASVGSVIVEGAEDVVDVLTFTPSGTPLWARQLKTRAEPHTWRRGDLVSVLSDWAATPLAGDVPFSFLTDGQFNSWVKKLADVLAAGDCVSAAQMTGLAEKALRGVTLRSRLPDAEILLERAQLHLLRAGEPLVTASQARTRIDGLLHRVLTASGSAAEEDRLLTVEEISLHLGLLPASSSPLRIGDLTPAAVDRSDLVDAVYSRLRYEETARGRVWLWGFSGFGKTTIAERVHTLAIESDRAAAFVRIDGAEDAYETLGVVARQLRGGDTPSDWALTTLATEIASATAAIDLLVCDDLRSDEAARILAASVAPRTALLITTRSQHAAPAYDAVEVGPLSDNEVGAFLQFEVNDAAIAELAPLVFGWPLVMSVVGTSLRRHLALGGDPKEIVEHHSRRLRARDADDSIGQPAKRAIELALETTSGVARSSALSLGVLRSSLPQPVDLFGALWNTDLATTRSIVVELASVGLMRLSGSGAASVHDALLVTLHSMTPGDESIRLHSRFSTGIENMHRLQYVLQHLPDHLSASGQHRRALDLIADVNWCSSVSAELGTPLFLSRQAGVVIDNIATRPEVPGVDLVAAWLVQRLYAAQFVLDHRVAAIFAAANGLELTEALLRSAGSPHETALAHAQLAITLSKVGRLEDAERNADLALRAARAEAQMDLPDTMIVTVQRLARAGQHWVRASLEAIEHVISTQQDDSSRDLTRAVAAAALLPLDPGTAVQVGFPIIDRARAAVGSNASLEEAFGSNAEPSLRNLLPLLAYHDYDLALAVLDQGVEEELLGGEDRALVATGALLAGATLSEEDQLWIAAGTDETVSRRDIVVFLAKNSRYEEAIAVASSEGSRRSRALMHAAIGRIMWADEETARSDAQFEAALAQLRGLPDSDLISVLPPLAMEVMDVDASWATRLAGQAIRYSQAARSASERVGIEGESRAILAMLDPTSDQGQLTDLFARARAFPIPGQRPDPNVWIDRVEDAVLAAIVSQVEEVPVDLLQSVRNPTNLATKYWSAWSSRLARSPNVDEARALVAVPSLSSILAYTADTTPLVARALLRAGADEDLQSLVRRTPDSVDRERLGVEITLLGMLYRDLSLEAAAEHIRRVSDMDVERRGLLAAEVIGGCLNGDVAAALVNFLQLYSDSDFERNIARLAAGGVLRIRTLPLSVRTAVDQRISMSDLDHVLGTTTDGRAVAFVEDLVAFAIDLSVSRLCELRDQHSARHSRLLPVVMAGMERLVQVEAIAVATWLMEQSTAEYAPHEVLGFDQWASLASWVLAGDLLDPDTRGDLVNDARERLAADDDRVELADSVRLTILLAPDDPIAAKKFVEGACSPFVNGAALCLLASVREDDGDSWLRAFEDGLATIGASTGEALTATTSLLGAAIDEFGVDGLKRLAAEGVLKKWPGGFVGAASTAIAMARIVVSEVEVSAVVGQLALIRRASDTTAHLLRREVEMATSPE